MRTIAGNIHLNTSLEVHWLVSVRWREQSGVHLLDEWTDLAASAIDAERLYDGWGPGTVVAEALLASHSEVAATGDLRQESEFTFEVSTTAELAGHPGSYFTDLYDADYPPEYADVFVSLVLGSGASRTTVLCWAGAIESVEGLEDRVRVSCKDPSRKLLLPLVGRIDTDDYPGVEPGFVGQSKPLAVGELTQFVGIPVVQQYLTSLEVSLDSTTTTGMKVGSTADMAASGTVLVDGERIDYTGKTDDELTGLTRGAGGTTATTHPAGTLVFAATGQTLNGQDVDGPVFLLHGAPLAAGAAVTKALAHGNEGRSSYEIPLSDVVQELAAAGGAQVGLVDGYPQNPDQVANSAWYAVEMDADAKSNQTASWRNAAGAEGTGEFDETNFALVYDGGRLTLRRDAAVEPVGGQRMEKVYLLVEYANLTTPVPGGNHVPNDGVNTAVYWRDSGGTQILLGSLSPEQEPLPDEVDDATRTVRTRPMDDQHRHTLSAPVGVAGPQGGVLVIDASRSRLNDDPPGNTNIKRPNAGAAPAERGDCDSVWGNQDSQTYLLAEFDTGFADLYFYTDSESAILNAFRSISSLLARAYYIDYPSFNPNSDVLEVQGNDGVDYGTKTQLGGGQVEVSGPVGDTLSKVWPLRQHVRLQNDSFSLGGTVYQDQEQFSYSDPLRLALEPDASALPTVVLYGTELSITGGSTSDPEALEVSNGLRPTYDESHAWSTGNCFLAAPNGTADVKRLTVMWRGAPGATLNFRRPNGAIVRTVSNGTIYDLSNEGLSIGDLDHAYLNFAGGGGSITWLRVIVEYEGQLSDTDDETSQRISSLKAFDISEHVDLEDWGSLRQTDVNDAANTAFLSSPDSTGAFNSTELNNDSLWVVRVSFLIKAAPPITQLAQAVSFTFRGMVGYAQGGAESRAAGDVLLELLTGSDYLGIDGTTFFADGWCEKDSFYSDVDGPSAVLNGAVYDAQDALDLLADMADQVQHLLHWEHGRLKLSPVVTSGWGAAVQTFTDSEILAPVVSPARPAESILNRVVVEYDQDYVRRGFRDSVTEESASSQGKYGTRRDEAQAMRHNDKNATDAGSVQDAQAQAQADSMLARFGVPATAVYFDVPLVGLALEVGDVVALSTAAYTASKVEVTSLVYIPSTAGQGGVDRVRVFGLVRAV